MFNANWIGTFVNKDTTSKETIISSVCSNSWVIDDAKSEEFLTWCFDFPISGFNSEDNSLNLNTLKRFTDAYDTRFVELIRTKHCSVTLAVMKKTEFTPSNLSNANITRHSFASESGETLFWATNLKKRRWIMSQLNKSYWYLFFIWNRFFLINILIFRVWLLILYPWASEGFFPGGAQ